MSRLGVLYALKEDELNKLRSLPHDERYDYMLGGNRGNLIGNTSWL